MAARRVRAGTTQNQHTKTTPLASQYSLPPPPHNTHLHTTPLHAPVASPHHHHHNHHHEDRVPAAELLAPRPPRPPHSQFPSLRAASSARMPPRQSTLTNNQPLHLPPLTSAPKSHPTSSTAHVPVVYALKLTDETANAIISAAHQTILKFNDASAGTISLPGRDPLHFTTHSVDENADTARAACFTRRGSALRVVGPIVAEIDLHRRLSRTTAATTKKRTLDARNTGKGRDLKVVNDIPTPAKKQRTRKTLEKRPRPALPAASLISAPTIQTPAAPKLTAPSNPTIRGLRSAPAAISPPYKSPVLSPSHANTNGKPVASRRNTPTRNSFSGMQSRKLSPNGSIPASLPRPGGRMTPTKSMRMSPGTSRGPSPRPPSVHSPSSPRVGSQARVVHEDRVELRRGVIHILALGEVAMTGLRRRLGISDTAGGHEMLISILAEVADSRKGNYTLRERLWAEASDGYPAYSEIERSRMKANRKEALGANAEAKIRMQSLSEEQFDDEVNAFEKGYQRDVGVVTNDREESGMRKQFAQLYPLYTEVIARMEELQKSFVSLAGKFKAARTAQEKDSLAKRLQANHMKHKNRYLKYERVLPLLHRRMKGMHKALEGYLKEET